MAVWLNMSGKDASLCASLAEGVEKIKRMFAIRMGYGAQVIPHPGPIALDVRYKVISQQYGTEEFWLSDMPESGAQPS